VCGGGNEIKRGWIKESGRRRGVYGRDWTHNRRVRRGINIFMRSQVMSIP
jgi:hypothetical protein